MLIKNSQIKTWKDLQKKVKQLFLEMNYEAETSKTVKLAGRGKKEIDVFVKDKLASINQIYLIECKFWNKNVPQEVVHSFKTIMEETGANTGFIISKKGFQKGAFEAIKYTNIHLMTFEEFQHKYGNEWYRKKKNKLDLLNEKLKQIANLHFDQFNTLHLTNNMFFHNEDLRNQLYFYYHLINRFITTPQPDSYLGPEPFIIYFNPQWEYADNIDFRNPEFDLTFENTRDYYTEMINGAKQCINGFEKLWEKARGSFDLLNKNKQSEIFAESIKQHTDELPLRVLKNIIKEDDYNKLVNSIEQM